jgi:hypothetical protein
MRAWSSQDLGRQLGEYRCLISDHLRSLKLFERALHTSSPSCEKFGQSTALAFTGVRTVDTAQRSVRSADRMGGDPYSPLTTTNY